MMERMTLPLEQSFQNLSLDETLGPLNALRKGLVDALSRIATDPQTRRIFEVATQKVEYVDELQAVRLRHLAVRGGFTDRVQTSLRFESKRQQLALCIPTLAAAQGLHALINGLIQNWLLDQHAFDLVGVGEAVMNVYLKGLGFQLSPLPSPFPLAPLRASAHALPLGRVSAGALACDRHRGPSRPAGHPSRAAVCPVAWN